MKESKQKAGRTETAQDDCTPAASSSTFVSRGYGTHVNFQRVEQKCYALDQPHGTGRRWPNRAGVGLLRLEYQEHALVLEIAAPV